MSLKKIYLLIGITTASVFLSSIAGQAQTTELPEQNTSNAETVKSSFERTKTDREFMAQLSAPQNDTSVPTYNPPITGQNTPLDNTVPPTTPSAPLDGTVPSDGTQTIPSSQTPPSDYTPTTPSTQTPPSDYTPTTPSTQTPPSNDNNPPFGSVNPGTATRSGSSYIGVGGNIGIGGDTGIGEGSFSVLSKIGLTPNLSARPSVFFGDDVAVLLPVTVDFPISNVETTNFNIAPYIGGGAIISTGDDTDVGLLLTGGIDVPLSSQFTATAGVNVGFVGDTDVGILIGVGYNFSGL